MNCSIIPKRKADSRNINQMCSLIIFSFGSHCVLRGIALPAIKADFGTNYSGTALLVSLSMIGYFIVAWFSSKISSCTGQKNAMSLYSFLLAVTALGIVASRSFYVTALMFFAAGGCYDGIESTSTALVHRYNPASPDLAVNTIYSFYSVGSCIIAVVGGFLLLKGAGWRISFALVALLNAIAAINSYTIEDSSANAAPSASFSEIRELVKDPVFDIMCIATAILSGAEAASINWMNTFLSVSRANMNIFESSCTTALFFASIYVGRLVVTRILSKHQSITVTFVFSLICASIVMIISFINNAPLMIVSIAFFGFSVSCLYPLLTSITSGLSELGIVYSVSFGVISLFNFLTNSMMGVIADNLSLPSAFRFCALLYLLVALLILSCRNRIISRSAVKNA